MAEPTGGPSLVQGPEPVSNSDNLFNTPDTTLAETTDLASISDKRQLTDSSDSLVTEIHQTVSLIHVVSPDGTPIEIKTVYSPPTTVLVDPTTGAVVEPVTDNSAASPADPVIPTPPLVTDVPAAGGLIASEVESLIPTDLDVIAPLSSDLLSVLIPDPTPSPTVGTDDDAAPLETGSSSSVFPTISSFALVPSGYRNISSFGHTNETLSYHHAKFRSTTLRSSGTSTSATESPTAIIGTGSGGTASGGGVAEGGTAIEDSSSGEDSPMPTAAVVGSVVGSVAGAALIIFVIMALLRWRKKQSGRLRLSDGPTSGSRGLIADGENGGGDGGVTQRSNPFVVPAVLSSLASYKSPPSPNAKSQETGFYRISGKKLPSVLQYGGDGFTDPRASTMSGASSTYPDQPPPPLIDIENGGAPMLALGNPMRPVSGVVMMRSSPARTPVTEHNPFLDPSADPFTDPPSPACPPTQALRPDAVGRSLTAQDVSRGSSSRFMEDF
ncbi:hypothetical protein jhhlp_002471 [Lomentospora prolificans]|uniref:Uncharacterized protein n=1 Tax=Lomentospora prolificans TaxID=41688 RepID=A0A2N3NE64_9PEZI|nr:hypothetical protein jhhlp_002471 [Lomentospora prolificans]